MKKAWTIAWKDTLIRFRDRNALLINLLAPLLLAGIMGAAFGGQGNGSNPFSDIPIIIVNKDTGEFGNDFITILSTAEGLNDLFAVNTATNLDDAIKVVEQGEARAVIYLPAGFSHALQPEAGSTEVGDPATVQLYTDPAASISPVIVRGVLENILAGFNKSSLSAKVVVEQLTGDHAKELGPKLAQLEAVMGTVFEENAGTNQSPITITQIVDIGEDDEPVNPLLFFTPSMAIFFLMFSMIEGSRGLLDEKIAGTLDRLFATPTTALQIVLGKIGGTFLIGILQMTILIVASSLAFGISWGTPVGVVLITVGVVAAATSLGTFIAAFATQPNQVQIMGTAISLIFAMLGGNFVPAEFLPAWMQPISKLTLNRWALDGYTQLAVGRVGVSDILTEASALFGIALFFFVLGVWQFQKRLKK